MLEAATIYLHAADGETVAESRYAKGLMLEPCAAR